MKKTIALVEVELIKEQRANQKLAEQLVEATRKIESDATEIENLEHHKMSIEKKNSHLAGRCTELLAAHDILLRQSLRASGMAWEDIERTIHQSREGFNMHSVNHCGCGLCNPNRGGNTINPGSISRGY